MQNTKKSLIASGVALLASVALLAGATFAWFTDSVVNTGNKIEAGTLNIDLLQLADTLNDGQKEALEEGGITPADGTYVSIADVRAPIFDYDRWEPGYSEAVVLKVANAGSLALKWNLQLIANGEVGILGDVIDVYARVSEGAAITELPANFSAVTAAGSGYTRVGTLNELIADPDGAARGVLYAANAVPDGGCSEAYAAIVLHMQEGADNDYQNKSIGSTLDIVLNAGQYAYETDGFDNPNYDMGATLLDANVADAADLAEEIGAQYDADTRTVTLTKPVTTDKQMVIADCEAFTLDLNGQTMTMTSTPGYALESFAEMTIRGGTLAAPNAQRGIYAHAPLTVENATLEAKDVAIAAFDDVTIQDSTLEMGENGYALCSFNNDNHISVDNCTINLPGAGIGIYHNGSYRDLVLDVADTTINAPDGVGVYISASLQTGLQTATFTDCTITGSTGIEVKYTDLTLNNCTVTATGEVSYVQNNNGSTTDGFAVVSSDNSMAPDSPKPEGTITIDGGVYTGPVGLIEYINGSGPEATYVIYAGTFDTDISAYVAEGSTVNEADGVFTVTRN